MANSDMKDFIFVGDIHLNSLLSCEYRWNVFDKAIALAKTERYQSADIVFLGDLTDAKDRHSGELVNRFIQKILYLANVLGNKENNLFIVRGNHDYLKDERKPFFEFIEDLAENIYFPQEHSPFLNGLAVVPNIRPESEMFSKDNMKKILQDKEIKVIATHFTIAGAEADNGYTLESGVSQEAIQGIISKGVHIVSGDLHYAQKKAGVIYPGAPHPVSFQESKRAFLTRHFLFYDSKQDKFENIEPNDFSRATILVDEDLSVLKQIKE